MPQCSTTGLCRPPYFEAEEQPADQANAPKVITLTYGFSKDHRPDLKQAVLSLAVAGGSGAPLWMTPRNGDAADQKTLQETIERVEAFRREIDCNDPTRWIADASLHTVENLVNASST